MGRLRHEAGQTVVLFAVLLPLFLGLGAIAVDVGYWYVVKKTAQDAADAAALAAARELPDGDPVGVARDYVDRNMPGATADVTTPYGVSGDPKQVEVTVSQSAGTFFGGMFGILDVSVSRRAVAEQRPAVNDVAFHAHDTNCANDAIVFQGDGIRIQGVIQSNGSFKLNGDDFNSGPASAGGPNSCSIAVSGSNPSFAGNAQPAFRSSTQGWPVYFIPAEFHCDFEKRNFVFPDPNSEIPPGVYCAEESFEATGDNQFGTITVLSPRIEIDGKNQRFAPAAEGKGLLFFHIANNTPQQEDDLDTLSCQHSAGMRLRGDGYELRGFIFNPCAGITIRGSGSVQGIIEGLTVDVKAVLEMEADGELPNQVRLSLAE